MKKRVLKKWVKKFLVIIFLILLASVVIYTMDYRAREFDKVTYEEK